jgi:hypothetical protein
MKHPKQLSLGALILQEAGAGAILGFWLSILILHFVMIRCLTWTRRLISPDFTTVVGRRYWSLAMHTWASCLLVNDG